MREDMNGAQKVLLMKCKGKITKRKNQFISGC